MATPHFDLPDLVEASAGNVTRANANTAKIDGLIMPSVVNRTQTSAPSYTVGNRYIAATGVSGWTGERNGVAAQTYQAGDFILAYGGAWVGWSPQAGMVAYVAAEGIVVMHDGTSWVFWRPYRVTTGITTAGTTQGAATQLNFGISQLTVVAAGATACKLPAAEAGAQCTVINADAADTALVFPASGDQINALAVDASFSLAAGKSIILVAINATNWYGVLTA